MEAGLLNILRHISLQINDEPMVEHDIIIRPQLGLGSAISANRSFPQRVPVVRRTR